MSISVQSLNIYPTFSWTIGSGFSTASCSGLLAVITVLPPCESGTAAGPAARGILYCGIVASLNAPGIDILSVLNFLVVIVRVRLASSGHLIGKSLV